MAFILSLSFAAIITILNKCNIAADIRSQTTLKINNSVNKLTFPFKRATLIGR